MAAAAAAALILLLAACCRPAEGAVAEIGPTIYIGGIQDLQLDGSGVSKCNRLVDSALSYGSFSNAQFLVSVLWWDSGPRDPPPGWDGCDNYTLSTYYCFGRFNSTSVEYYAYGLDDNKTAIPVNASQVATFRDLLADCLGYAVDRGLDVSINVHLDDGRQQNGWRNTLPFNPLWELRGFSYYDAVLEPIVGALNLVLHNSSDAWLSLQGEMGATVFFFPWEWARVADMVRDRLRPELRDRVRLGLGINNSKLCGCVLIDIIDYNDYLRAFAPLWPSIMDWFDMRGIREAFTTVEYVGISAYVPQARTDFQPCDMENLVKMMDIEFSYYNLTLRELVDMGKEIHWIEWGIGGGVAQTGDQPARTALGAAHTPYFGVQSPYNKSRDPWQIPEVRDYMRYFVNQTSEYLLQGGCDYQVGSVFLWTVGGSWDVLGLYDRATGAQDGTFRDEVAVEEIRQHNDEARRLNAEQAPAGQQAAPADGRAAPAGPNATALLAGR
ncbi:hypothetical protein C2E21_6228 [Chlorella sorokiniana]|uniref:Uncharacterized protein n=1 Tax=Chlorella sorokiniana TaxID=3076 RepID=A0A2P6TLL0_CHLSO|nr:hypothetical protein C2E21_6228 [Chlorella sorokiniana]|eukprot:PRW45181.1 hypothetical protein C2E21_6228 [Chlorella sorokiniana]